MEYIKLVPLFAYIILFIGILVTDRKKYGKLVVIRHVPLLMWVAHVIVFYIYLIFFCTEQCIVLSVETATQQWYFIIQVHGAISIINHLLFERGIIDGTNTKHIRRDS